MKKKILIVDESDLFREYLRSRLSEFAEVETAINGLDGVSKLRSDAPDCLVIDYHLTRKSCKEVLEDKTANPNTSAIPVVLTAQKIDKNRLLELMPFNIRKVIMKPIKVDGLFATLTEILGIGFRLDETPSIVEAHVNDNIVFIEIAQGLNREKIDLLRFKIAELVELYQIRSPRILLMISDIELGFSDGPNLELLLGILLEAAKGKAKHVKILTNAAFVKDFAAGRPGFLDLEVLSSLQYAMDGLLSSRDNDSDSAEQQAQIISERILAAHAPAAGGAESVEMRFDSESRKAFSLDAIREAVQGLAIAVVDDDFVIQELIRTTFTAIGADVTAFPDGTSFLDAVHGRSFDLVFLDILMPGIDGFQVLSQLHAEDIGLPIIVLSAVSQKEAVIRAFHAGVRSYLIKPLKPDQILKKTLEILKANF